MGRVSGEEEGEEEETQTGYKDEETREQTNEEWRETGTTRVRVRIGMLIRTDKGLIRTDKD